MSSSFPLSHIHPALAGWPGSQARREEPRTHQKSEHTATWEQGVLTRGANGLLLASWGSLESHISSCPRVLTSSCHRPQGNSVRWGYSVNSV